jgi:hypothetical protein
MRHVKHERSFGKCTVYVLRSGVHLSTLVRHRPPVTPCLALLSPWFCHLRCRSNGTPGSVIEVYILKPHPDLTSQQSLLFCKYPFRISAGVPGLLTEVFVMFLSFFQVNVSKVPWNKPRCLLTSIHIHHSSHPTTPYSTKVKKTS